MRGRKVFVIVFIVALFTLAGVWVYPISKFVTRAAGVSATAILVASILALSWPRRSIRPGIVILLLLALAFMMIPGYTIDSSALREQYSLSLLSYLGAPYVWGGESHRGIDCSGFVRRAFINACFQLGIRTLNPALIRLAFQVWWKDASASDLASGYQGFTRPVLKAASLNSLDSSSLRVGDLAILATGVHVLAYIGQSRWISADPYLHSVVVSKCPDPKNAWFSHRVQVFEWTAMSPQD